MTIRKKFAGAALAAGFALLAAPLLAQGGPWGRGRSSAGSEAAQLSEAERRQLVFMREEEKLARDVYRMLFEKWQLPVFERIAESEQRHFEAVGRVLARYAIPDPVKDDKTGVFMSGELAAMYAEWTTKGAVNAQDALEVGVKIEKEDIADLEEAINSTQKMDLKRLYANLLRASLNHLRAFESNLAGTCLQQ